MNHANTLLYSPLNQYLSLGREDKLTLTFPRYTYTYISADDASPAKVAEEIFSMLLKRKLLYN